MSEDHDAQRMGRVLHLAMDEILGTDGLRSLMEAALPGNGTDSDPIGAEFTEDGRFSISRLERVFSALEQQYGEAAGRGTAQRIGRACFPYGLREYGDALGMTSTSFRLLPFPTKLQTFAGALAEMFNGMSDECVRVEERDGKLRWLMEPCPFCQGRQAEHSLCLLPVGLAEEALYWLSGGKMFNVEEVACMARGDAACIVQADETPLS